MNYIIKLFSLFPLLKIVNDRHTFKLYIFGINIIHISKKKDNFYVKLFKTIPILKIINESYSNIEKQQNNYLKIIEKLKNKITNNEKINVLFFINEISKWKTRKLYETLKADERFNVQIIATYLPVYESFAFDKDKEINLIKNYFERNNIEYTFIESNDKKTFKKFTKNTDIFFTTQPWGLRKYMKPHNLNNSLVYYIPYYVPSVNNMLLDYKLDFHPYIFRYYVTNVQWEQQFKYYAKEKYKIEADNIFGIGHTQLDNYINIKEEENKNYVIYAPHISFFHPKNVRNRIEDYSGTFNIYGKEILEYAKNTKDKINWVWKPHPDLKQIIKKTEIMTENEVNTYYSNWEKLGIACYDADYIKLFRESKCLITDCRSFTIEYFTTKKPIIRLVSKHFTLPLPPQVQDIYDSFYNAYNLEDLYNFIDEVVIKGNDYMKEKRLKVLEEQNLLNSNATENIYNDIKNTLGIE